MSHTIDHLVSHNILYTSKEKFDQTRILVVYLVYYFVEINYSMDLKAHDKNGSIYNT